MTSKRILRISHLWSLRNGSQRSNLSRIVQLTLVAAVLILSTGAGDPSARYDKLSHQLMCACSCNELLGECNHVSCPDSGPMTAELKTAVNRGDPDKTILINFQNEYGPTALAAPRFTAFNHLAWILPYLILVLGVGGAAFVVRRWRLQSAPIPARPDNFSSGEFNEARDRIRRETEV